MRKEKKDWNIRVDNSGLPDQKYIKISLERSCSAFRIAEQSLWSWMKLILEET